MLNQRKSILFLYIRLSFQDASRERLLYFMRSYIEATVVIAARAPLLLPTGIALFHISCWNWQ